MEVLLTVCVSLHIIFLRGLVSQRLILISLWVKDEEMFKESRVIYSLENPDGNIPIDEIRGRKNN